MWFAKFASLKAGSYVGSSVTQNSENGFSPRKAITSRRSAVHWLVTVFVVFLAIAGAGRADAQSVDWVVNLNDVGSDPIPAGGTIAYNITVSNDGSDPAPTTTISFAIAAGTTFTGGDRHHHWLFAGSICWAFNCHM